MSGFRSSAALKTFGLAAIGYLVVLAIGVAIGLAMDDDGFAGLGVIALTTVVLAPIGAVVGAYIGMKRFGDPARPRVGWGITSVIAALAAVATLVVEAPFQIMIVPVALALVFIVRSGLGTPVEIGGIAPGTPAA